MNKRQKRMASVFALVLGVAVAAVLGLTAFRKNMMYYYNPSDLVSGSVPESANVRLGGMVQVGSFKRGSGLDVSFVLTDCEHHIAVDYTGILPDLFREGQGIVATGHLQHGVFMASEVLAKHDEKYMPPDLAKKMKNVDPSECAVFRPAAAQAS